MKITVLGCGSSMGTPSAGGFWGRCDRNEPKNERTRASILVQDKGATLLVDATCDVRMQVNRHGIRDLDGIILSHAHSDHINGIDDLRAIAFNHEKMLDLYGDEATLREMKQRAPYLFRDDHKVYVPFLKPHVVPDNGTFMAAGINVRTFQQDHFTCNSLGLCFGDFAYSVDMFNLDDKALSALKGVEVWLVDGGAYHKESTSTHANIRRVLEWVDILKPKMTYVTVLSNHMDYKTLCGELPAHVRPAWDGQVIEMGTNRI